MNKEKSIMRETAKNYIIPKKWGKILFFVTEQEGIGFRYHDKIQKPMCKRGKNLCSMLIGIVLDRIEGVE